MDNAADNGSGASKIVFEAKDLTIQFGGLRANDGVSFAAEHGDFFGLIGPNGAGKTTVFNAITGSVPVSAGDIALNGETLLKKRPDQIARLGVSRTYQNIRLFGSMTAEENVAIGIHCVPGYSRVSALLGLPVVKKKDAKAKENTLAVMEILNLLPYKDNKAAGLPYGIQRKLEIARALATQPKLLLLDEPAAGMNNDECNELVALLKRVHKEFNLTVILIEHHIDLVVELCSRICVLNLGKVLASGLPGEIQRNPEVVRAYLGDRKGISNG